MTIVCYNEGVRGQPSMVRGSKDYSVERDSIMNLVSKASELAMEKSNYLKDMQKWEKCPALANINTANIFESLF